MTAFGALLSAARRDGQVVFAFNCYSLESVSAAVRVAAHTGRPVIVAHGEKYLENVGLRPMRALVSALAQDAGCVNQVLLHLDHAADAELCAEAARLGYDSVMFDGSHLPYDQNVALTAQVTRHAHQLGVGVEAELGSLATGAASHEFDHGEEHLTDPAQAHDFVQATGIDALAVSIGTVHGLYRGEPHLDLERLRQIAARVPQPLVLHGGSGTPFAALRSAMHAGIAKINVNTEVALAGTAALLNAAQALGPEAHAAALGLAAGHAMETSMLTYVTRYSDPPSTASAGPVK